MAVQPPTTHWSRVLQARDGTESERRRALAALCEDYWYPLYAFIRHQGYDRDEARDLTQGFFTYLLEKNVLQSADPAAGRFRSFLLASLKHFLSHERERAQAMKRGGGASSVSLDAVDAERRYGLEAGAGLTPEQVFERRWALAVVEKSLLRLRAESDDGEGLNQFDHLKVYLTGEKPRRPYREVAGELGMSEAAVKTAVHRLRLRFGALLRGEVAETCVDPDEVDDELRHLLLVISPFQPARA